MSFAVCLGEVLKALRKIRKQPFVMELCTKVQAKAVLWVHS